jgi:hypothetical protein
LLFEKMAHFNRERFPERVVHAKGSGAYGHFVCTGSEITKYTRRGGPIGSPHFLFDLTGLCSKRRIALPSLPALYQPVAKRRRSARIALQLGQSWREERVVHAEFSARIRRLWQN